MSEKYPFVQYASSAFRQDPIFHKNEREFALFGDPRSSKDIDLFEVDYGPRRIRYCLIGSRRYAGDKDLSFKIACYLYHHPSYIDDTVVTYFIGDSNVCAEVSEGFINQIVKIISLDMIEQWYPKTVEEISEKIIRFLIKEQQCIGEAINFNSYDKKYLFFNNVYVLDDEHQISYMNFIHSYLETEQYLTRGRTFDDREPCFYLSSKAYKKYEITKDNSTSNNYAFIAIKFDGNHERIEHIQNSIAKAGFEPVIMNQLETNNWIMPEIFKQIERSKFVVVDFSLPCDGAYYEAGYAAALNKTVIHLFDKREQTENNKLHFDIAQKSTIFYEDFDDLEKRLINRINATVKE